jgi:hypothetical protein
VGEERLHFARPDNSRLMDRHHNIYLPLETRRHDAHQSNASNDDLSEHTSGCCITSMCLHSESIRSAWTHTAWAESKACNTIVSAPTSSSSSSSRNRLFIDSDRLAIDSNTHQEAARVAVNNRKSIVIVVAIQQSFNGRLPWSDKRFGLAGDHHHGSPENAVN